MFPFFVAGFFLNKYNALDSFYKHVKAITIFSGLTYFGLLLFFTKETYIYWSDYTVLNGGGWHQSLVNIQRTITGFSGVFFVMGIVKLIYPYCYSYWRTVFDYLGKNTLQLYVISTLPVFIRVEVHFSNGRVNYFLAFLTTVFVAISSMAIIEVLKRINITNVLFFGQKSRRQKCE